MSHQWKRLAIALTLSLAGGMQKETSAQTPQSPQVVSGVSEAIWLGKSSPTVYRVLPRPTLEGPVPSSPTPTLVARPMEPYAYGWFGAKPAPSWQRSFGINRSYTQWTLK